jgi:hypothetical protein
MFTNEFHFDHTQITILDETGLLDDVQVFLDEEGVVIEQFSEEMGDTHKIILTPKMFQELIVSLNYPEGFYKIK